MKLSRTAASHLGMNTTPHAPAPPGPAPALTRPPPAPRSTLSVLLYVTSLCFFPTLVGIVFLVARLARAAEPFDETVLLAALVVLGVVGSAIGIQRSWKVARVHPGRAREHAALLARLQTTWARVAAVSIVDTVTSSEGALTHHVLSLELEGASTSEAGYRQGAGGGGPRWQVRWPVAASLSGYVVPGIWVGVAYDHAAPAASATVFPQCLLTTSGATLPIE